MVIHAPCPAPMKNRQTAKDIQLLAKNPATLKAVTKRTAKKRGRFRPQSSPSCPAIKFPKKQSAKLNSIRGARNEVMAAY